jgi:hypothetical protein
MEGGAWGTRWIDTLPRGDADSARPRVLNRRITVTIQRRSRDLDAPEAWEPEESFTYDPSSLKLDDAVEIRPRIDHAIRLLYITGDYLGEWIKPRLKEKAQGEAS